MSQTLGLALRARGEEGTPLPGGHPRLDQIGVKFRRGQMSLIAGAPGGGKSALATHLLTKMRYDDGRGVPTVYFSADADRMTVAKSIFAGLAGMSQDQAEEKLVDHSPEIELLDAAMDHVWWSFDAMPSLRDIEEEIDAFAYVYGEYPHLVVVDNLIDVAESGEDLAHLSDVQIRLKELARFTGCHMMVLHHVTKEFTNGTTPIPRSGLMYGVDKKAELILTIYQVQPGLMGIRVVKNRTGEADTKGQFGINVPWLANRGWWG